MYKFEMGGCRIECECLEVFQNLLAVVMKHCNEKLAPPVLATRTGYRGEYENQKINQIKVVRNLTGMGLADAKDWVEGKAMWLSRSLVTQLVSAGFEVRS